MASLNRPEMQEFFPQALFYIFYPFPLSFSLNGIFPEIKDYWSVLHLIGRKNPPSYLDLEIIHVTGLYFKKAIYFPVMVSAVYFESFY